MAHLLIIELPGGNDVDIVQAAIERGDEFTFLSSQLDLYHKQAHVNAVLALAWQQIESSSFDYTDVERVVLAIHSDHPIDAVLCLLDIRMVEAAKLADRLQVRHVSPEKAALLRDKFSVRCRLQERGLPQPDFALADSNDALKKAVEELGLPVLIKPADGYGSQNIVVLRYPEDIDPLLSPLDDMLPCHADYGLGVRANDRLLVERYMTGTVIGCDTLTVNGHHILLGVNEKQFYDPPSFAIRGGCFTPNCPAFFEIERYVFSALDAVGFDWGATHTELMLTANGPRLIEINPRLVGAKIARLVGYALNRSIHSDLIDVHLGLLPAMLTAEGPNMVAITRWIVAEQEGILESVQLPPWSDTRIRCVEILKKPGDRVRPPLENADRIGYVMVCGPTRSESQELADHLVSQISVKLKSLSSRQQASSI